MECRPTCESDGCNSPAKKSRINKSGEQKYRKLCSQCTQRKYDPDYLEKKRERNRQYRRVKYGNYIKGDTCEKCGFVAVHRCQMDVDHIDGNHRNDDHKNLQTLCGNCHRLKTFINQDWKTT